MLARWRFGLALAAAVVATAAGAATAWAAYTWEGTWSSTFGDIKMNADGSGTYPGGTISGGISGAEGRTNKGRWQESSTAGTYEFHMSPSGGSFDGTYERDGGGCVFPPCDWDGTACIKGPCLQNSAVQSDDCRRADTSDCDYEIRFGFDLRRGLPHKPSRDELAPRLVSVDGDTEGTRLFGDKPRLHGGEFFAAGKFQLTTRYREGGRTESHRITVDLRGEGNYDRAPDEVAVDAPIEVIRSQDENCPPGTRGLITLEARKRDSGEKAVRLEMAWRDPCLTEGSDTLVWKNDDLKSFKIGRPRLVQPER